MAYATQSDLVPLRLTQTELAELTNDDGGDDVVAAVVTGLLEEASGRVESYCRQRYQTPLQASDAVKGLTLDITIFLLFTRRRTTKPNETVRQRYEDAIAMLKDIAAGRASLDQPATAASPQTSGGDILVTSQPQRFSDSNGEGYWGQS